MATLSEIQAMQMALDDYSRYMAKIEASASGTSTFAIGGAGATSSAIVQETRDNYARFIDRRNELVESDDHEAIAAYCQGIYKITGSPLPALIVSMNQSSDPVQVTGDVIKGTVSTIASGLKIGVPLVAIGALIVLAVLWKLEA